MPKLRKFALLVLLPAVLAMLLVACGGDDDDKGGDTDSPGGSSSENTDDGTSKDSNSESKDDKEDDNSKEGPLSGGTGGDAQYVAAICKASREWWDQLSSAFVDIDPEKPEEFMKGLMEPTRTYADQIAKAKPPKDIQEWHENLVAMFKDVVKGMESGEDFISDDAFGDFPDMPLAAQERLVKVAEKNEDCQALEEDGGAIFQ